jgi:hypothetical protein
MSDYWKAYEYLGKEGSGYKHVKVFILIPPPPGLNVHVLPPLNFPPSTSPPSTFQVNHSKNYKDPSTGSCTNTIEGKWNGLREEVVAT